MTEVTTSESDMGVMAATTSMTTSAMDTTAVTDGNTESHSDKCCPERKFSRVNEPNDDFTDVQRKKRRRC